MEFRVHSGNFDDLIAWLNPSDAFACVSPGVEDHHVWCQNGDCRHTHAKGKDVTSPSRKCRYSLWIRMGGHQAHNQCLCANIRTFGRPDASLYAIFLSFRRFFFQLTRRVNSPTLPAFCESDIVKEIARVGLGCKGPFRIESQRLRIQSRLSA